MLFRSELCEALLARICRESGFAVPRMPEHVLEQLRAHAFNGNVRELENILHRAVALGEGAELLLDAPPAPKPQTFAINTATDTSAARSTLTPPDNLQDYLDAQERDILCRVLHDTRYNRTAAASKLGMSLRQIRYRIARLGIAMPDGDTQEASHDSTNDAA